VTALYTNRLYYEEIIISQKKTRSEYNASILMGLFGPMGESNSLHPQNS
jgi:hypothetical protein